MEKNKQPIRVSTVLIYVFFCFMMVLYLAPLGEDAVSAAALLCQQLRTRGVFCETDITGRSAKAQLKYADKSGHTYVAVIGSDEFAKGECELKNLRTGEKACVALNADALERALKK